MKSIFLILVLVTSFTCYAAEESRSLKVSANRIVAIDWTHVETLLALGVTPLGIAQKQDYNAWVKEPKIPNGVLDLGLRTQPNLELLAELAPTQILISPMFSVLTPQLQKITKVTEIGLYKKGNVNWQAMESMTRELAMNIGVEKEAERFILQKRDEILALKQQVPSDFPPVLMVQFMDANHLRVFGDNSLYKTAVNELGIESAWQGTTNQWGFSLVGINELVGIDAQIVVIEPLPIGTEAALEHNQLWQFMSQQSNYPVLRMPAVWSFGALPSATRFARLFVRALSSNLIAKNNGE
ncbi:Ferric hydroxamate ABC transporter, periplasmic substrate binding protein FhuD [Moritella sp. JT01]|uniref:ABC transporter substrate-binding protein n=1 Tax=Moritella sp. JT01 TaxID=756698 RepID=UPI00079ADA99|nr:ABC transporter substrate-binding protein [Moritella sp. JT01]KXO07554.1 Ferric hydroxamate ABC transporter, periplasmic substrate binding protein FhuD [Moritella sp. JT01]